MTKPNQKKRNELIKLVIACGLGGVLLVLLVMPADREPVGQASVEASLECPPDPIVSESTSVPRLQSSRKPARPSDSNTSPEPQTADLPELVTREVDIESIVSHNPFRDGFNDAKKLVSTTIRGAGENDLSAVAHSSTSNNDALPPTISVDAIITGGNKPAALIGQQLYCVDDYVQDGWQIVAITSDGIRVRRSR